MVINVSLLAGVILIGGISCGGGGGGGSDDDASEIPANAATIQGNLSFSAQPARVLAAVEGGIAGVQISALGGSDVTDENGNFIFYVDGTLFPGGPAEFSLSGPGIEGSVVLNQILGGPGAVTNVNFFLEDSGQIGAEASDAAGNILSSVGRVACDVTDDFLDGPDGALWKPHSEATGTAVVLMPAQYQEAEIDVLNSRNEVVAGPIMRNCCSHNGGREHAWLDKTAESLAAAGPPLTVRFMFPNGFTDCRVVPDPTQRYD